MEAGKGRRSSILKPQKPRNPLSDLVEPVEVNSPVTKIADRTASRRVSFASSNFVKKFATDPEKNTILWDTTYEEMLNESDATHSSENVHKTYNMQSEKQSGLNTDCMTLHNRPPKVALTAYAETAESIGLIQHYVYDKNSERKASINFNEQGGEDIESDLSLCDSHREGGILETGNVKSFSSIKNVNVTKTSGETDGIAVAQQMSVISKEQVCVQSMDMNTKNVKNAHIIGDFPQILLQSSTVTDKENILQSGSRTALPSYSHRKLCLLTTEVRGQCSNVDVQKNIILGEAHAEFTQQVPAYNNCSFDGKNRTVVGDADMEFTQQLPYYNKCSVDVKNRTVVGEADIVFKQQLPAYNKRNFDMKNRTLVGDANMEFTQQLSTYNKCSSDVKNKTVVGDADMEFTQQLLDYNKCSFGIKNRTVVGEADIEFTQQLPSYNKCGFDVKNRTIVGDGDMEFTQQLPDYNKCGFDVKNRTVVGEADIEFTQLLPAYNKCGFDMKNRTLVEDANMEFTQQLPAYNKCSSDVKNKTVLGDADMEFTQQLPDYHKCSFDIKNRTVVGEADIEFTQQLPAYNKCGFDVKNRTVVGNRDTELTQQLPYSKCSFDVKKRTDVGEADIEFKQQLPAYNKCGFDVKNRTVVGNRDMEFTQQLPDSNKCTFDVKNRTDVGEADIEFKKQLPAYNKCNFDTKNRTLVGDANMEFIQQLPAYNKCSSDVNNKTVVGDADMEFTQQLPDSNKCTFDVKNRTVVEEADIEFKQQLPAYDKCSFDVNNKTLVGDTDMEFTRQLPVFNKSSYNLGNRTILNSDNMDFTRQLLVFDQNNSNVENKTLLGSDDLELTEQLPTAIIENVKPIAQSTVLENDMEFNQQLPIINKKTLNSIDSDKEVIQQFFALNVEDSNSTVSEPAILGNNNMNKETNNVSQNKIMGFTQQVHIANKENVDISNISTAAGDDNVNSIEEGHSLIANMSCPTVTGSKHVKVISLPVQHNVNYIGLETPGPSNRPETQNNINHEEAKEELREISIIKQNVNCSDVKTPGSSFHMNFTPFSPGIDDTQHLINYSLNPKQPKSDFSKLITGDLNPSFLSSKFMPLSEFSSDAFPVSLETTRSNQTHLEHAELECENCDTFPEIPEATHNNKTQLKLIGLNNGKNCEEHCENKPLPLITYIGNEKTIVSDKKGVSNLKRRSLENIETVVIRKKLTLDNSEQNETSLRNEDEKMETSSRESRTINISQEELTLSGSMVSMDDSFALINKAAKEVISNITQTTNTASSTDISTFGETASANNDFQEAQMRMTLKRKIEDFREKLTGFAASISKNSIILQELFNMEVEEFSRPFKQQSFKESKQSTDSNFSTESSLSEFVHNNAIEEKPPFLRFDSDLAIEVERVLTFKEKIEEKQKRCKHYWTLLSVEDDKCEFNTLYKTIQLVVHFDKETGIVNEIKMYCNISVESEPTALYVHKIFKERLSQEVIQSAVGKQYDVLTLLDYVQMNMRKMLQILKELNSFAKRFGLEMDRNMRVTFKIVSLPLRSTWCISVDLSDLENITGDSVTAYAKIGTVKEAEVKSFVARCPRGVHFLKNFIDSVLGYVELLKKRKTLIQLKVA